jgi:hypothetical protein
MPELSQSLTPPLPHPGRRFSPPFKAPRPKPSPTESTRLCERQFHPSSQHRQAAARAIPPAAHAAAGATFAKLCAVARTTTLSRIGHSPTLPIPPYMPPAEFNKSYPALPASRPQRHPLFCLRRRQSPASHSFLIAMSRREPIPSPPTPPPSIYTSATVQAILISFLSSQ